MNERPGNRETGEHWNGRTKAPLVHHVPGSAAPRLCNRRRYLISTFAPASSNFFLIVAASSFETPSLIGFGADSTRSFASFRPRLVTSRTTLITLILLPPMSVKVT